MKGLTRAEHQWTEDFTTSHLGLEIWVTLWNIYGSGFWLSTWFWSPHPWTFCQWRCSEEFMLLIIGLFLSLDFVRPLRSGPSISRSLCTRVCKSVLMSAASVRAQQSYWMRWYGQCYLGALGRTASPYYLLHLLLFFISKSLVTVILEQLIPCCFSIAVQTAFEDMSEVSPTDNALGAGKSAAAGPLEELGPKEKCRDIVRLFVWGKWLIRYLLLAEVRAFGRVLFQCCSGSCSQQRCTEVTCSSAETEGGWDTVGRTAAGQGRQGRLCCLPCKGSLPSPAIPMGQAAAEEGKMSSAERPRCQQQCYFGLVWVGSLLWPPWLSGLGPGRGWCCGWQVSMVGEKGQRTQMSLMHVSSGKLECSLQAHVLQLGPGWSAHVWINKSCSLRKSSSLCVELCDSKESYWKEK